MLSSERPHRSRRRRLGALAVTAITVAGALQGVTPASPALAAGPADRVVFWNDVLLQAYRDVGGAPGPLARNGAIMHLAMYDAANSVLCARRAADCLGQPYAIEVPGGGDFGTALDYAAHDTLTAVFGRSFEAKLDEAQAGVPDSPEKAAGRSIGEQAAAAMLAERANDGSANNTPYTFQTAPGAFRATVAEPPATPNWGAVRPFAMTSGAQFRPALPGGATAYRQLLTSATYTEQFNEVKSLGSVNSTTRTADQTEAAFFWANDVDGTYKPPGQLFEHTQVVAADQGVPVEAKVKLFAQVALAMADASILAWDRKYLGSVDLWRPETGIRQAATDNNPNTTADPNWQPLSVNRQGVRFSPNFPAFVSGHATFAYTWATVMKHWFGRDDVAFTGGTDDPQARGVTRDFASFSAAADENAHSRLWLGVHWHFDADEVLNPGTELGEFTVDNSLYYNTADEELLYLHRDGVTNPDECDDIGRQLSNEHRWEFWRCDVDGTSFDLYVH
jgi:hypothetical protein